MIRAIIFDCFGVLAVDGWLPFLHSHFDNNPTLFEKAIYLNKQTDSGLIPYDQFIKRVAELSGINESMAKLQIEDNPPNLELFEFIQNVLKPQYRIGVLSNSAANWLEEIFTPEQNKLFDAVALSYEIGAVKPDPKTYNTIAKRLNVHFDECIFIDDQKRYCEGADSVGMHTILFKNTKQLQTQLNEIIKIQTN